MKTLHTAYRVQNLHLSVDFYEKIGFREIGRVSLGDGPTLVMLNLPGDGEVVTLELVYDQNVDSFELGTGFSHIVVQVDNLDSTLADLDAKGLGFDELSCRLGKRDQEPASFGIRTAIES